MKRTVALACCVLAMTTSCSEAPSTVDASNATDAADLVARGRYLVTIAACHDCHTPFKEGPRGPEPDMARMLSGHPEQVELPPPPASSDEAWPVTIFATNTAWSGPWGVSFTANLTPDPDTGLGRWTLRNFMDTIRSGRHMGRGRPILPPMPILFYKELTDEDLTAVFAYLQSIPPIRNNVPEPLPAPGAEAPADVASSSNEEKLQ